MRRQKISTHANDKPGNLFRGLIKRELIDERRVIS